MIGYVFLNLAIMLVLLGVLFYMNKKHVSFTKRVFTGLGLGIVFGLLLQYFYEPQSEAIVKSVDWFNIVGSGYVKFLQMIVMPLVFISILSAFTRLKLTSNIGKISVLIIGILLGTTAIAAAVGITSATVFNLEAVQIEQGEAELSRGDQISETYGTIQDKTMPQQILELIPSNPFLDLTGARPTSTISVVIFAAFLGIAYLGVKRKQPEQAEFFAKIVDTLHSIIMRVVTLILRLTPYGILAIMTKTVATSDLDAILKLGKFVGASYVALIVMFLIHLLLLTTCRIESNRIFEKSFPGIIVCLHFENKCRSTSIEHPNTETTRGVRRNCQLCRILRLIDRSKRLCRHLSGHVSGHDRSNGGNRPTIAFIYSHVDCRRGH